MQLLRVDRVTSCPEIGYALRNLATTVHRSDELTLEGRFITNGCDVGGVRHSPVRLATAMPKSFGYKDLQA